MRVTTALGSQEVVLGLSAGATVGLLLGGLRRAAWLVLITMSGAELWLAALKALFHRQRPEPFFGTIGPPSYSFPSGHALLSLCCYGLIAGLASARLKGSGRWAVRIAAAILILAIGFSRVYLGVHYVTDVIGGYLGAIVWMAIVARL
jgi:undecaprenyl-diphosphatase